MADVPAYGTAGTNRKTGKSFFTQAGPRGGSWHVYDNGRKVFMPKKDKKRKNNIAEALKRKDTSRPDTTLNTTTNARAGQAFTTQKAKGGVFHTYGTKSKVFVKKKP